MKLQSIILFFLFMGVVPLLKAQAQNQFISGFSAEAGSKHAIVLNENRMNIQMLDLFFGYTLESKFCLGIVSGSLNILSFEDNTFEPYLPIGIGVRYQMFKKNPNKKKLGFEPYLNVLSGTNTENKYFIGYDTGLNLVHTECTHIYFGLGFSQFMYQNSDKDQFGLNAAFGFRY